jgi:hypothetical protein
LAVLELSHLPTRASPIKIAATSPERGAQTIAVGAHPDGSNSMWVYNDGSVKEVAPWTYPPPGSIDPDGQSISCVMVSTQNPINHGNSGGPLINDRCELIGICSLGINRVNSFTFVDTRHVKYVMENKPQERLPSWK